MKNCTGRNCIMQYGTVDPETCCAVSYCPYATPPITNADRIRAMADGELANAIWHDFGNSPWCYPTVTEGVLECNIIDARCEECILNWLKQEVEE